MKKNLYNTVTLRVSNFGVSPVTHYSLLTKILCGLAATATLTLTTACSDFLDIEPMNDVVLENYWTQKSDVTSVLMGCYESLESADCVNRMGLWGELRSDNLKAGQGTPYEVEQMIKENMLPTNSYCKWTAFYQTINRCNVVCHYAPIVADIDPNYTEAEMKANVAEAVAIRSLCYFYLIRTFRDVPFSRQPSIDDSQEYRLPATKFDAVLDSLIGDLESVKDNAPRRYNTDDMKSYIGETYSQSDRGTNTSRITRNAIYALLADLNLWKGDWDKTVYYADQVINSKVELYDEMHQKAGNLANIDLFNDIPLLLEKPVGSTLCGGAYNAIFGDGNSFEAIFELYYNQSQNVANQYVDNFYARETGGSMQVRNLSVPTEFYEGLPSQKTNLFAVTDCRAYENIRRFSSATHAISKYANRRISFNMQGTVTESTIRLNPTMWGNNCYANWIVYRLTDVMLMKAEALVERGGEADFEEAFRMVDAVYRRANNLMNATDKGVLAKDNYIQSQDAMRELVREERHRELMFEGKRWYDLLRMARREGNTRNLAEIVVQKQTVNQNGIKIKLADPNMLYYPYFRDELKVNPNLVQNPAYNTGVDEDLSKN